MRSLKHYYPPKVVNNVTTVNIVNNVVNVHNVNTVNMTITDDSATPVEHMDASSDLSLQRPPSPVDCTTPPLSQLTQSSTLLSPPHQLHHSILPHLSDTLGDITLTLSICTDTLSHIVSCDTNLLLLITDPVQTLEDDFFNLLRITCTNSTTGTIILPEPSDEPTSIVDKVDQIFLQRDIDILPVLHLHIATMGFTLLTHLNSQYPIAHICPCWHSCVQQIRSGPALQNTIVLAVDSKCFQLFGNCDTFHLIRQKLLDCRTPLITIVYPPAIRRPFPSHSNFTFSQLTLLCQSTTDPVHVGKFLRLPASTPILCLSDRQEEMDAAIDRLAGNIAAINNAITITPSLQQQYHCTVTTTDPITFPPIVLPDAKTSTSYASSSLHSGPSFTSPSYNTADPLLLELQQHIKLRPSLHTPSDKSLLAQILAADAVRLETTKTGVFPSPSIRQILTPLLRHTKIGRSRQPHANLGLFANGPIKKHTIIGTYSAPLLDTEDGANQPYGYSLKQGLNIGFRECPDNPLSFLFERFILINEYLHRLEGNNCYFDKFGMVIAKRNLKDCDELLISYGMYYNAIWDNVKVHYLSHISQALLTSLTKLPTHWNAPSDSQLSSFLNTATSAPSHYCGFHDCVRDFLHYSGHDPDQDQDAITFPRHNLLPVFQSQNVSQWVEAMLRCNWFFASHFFRRLCDPHKPEVPLRPLFPLNNSTYSGNLRTRIVPATAFIPPFGNNAPSRQQPTTAPITLIAPNIDDLDYLTFIYQYSTLSDVENGDDSDDDDSHDSNDGDPPHHAEALLIVDPPHLSSANNTTSPQDPSDSADDPTSSHLEGSSISGVSTNNTLLSTTWSTPSLTLTSNTNRSPPDLSALSLHDRTLYLDQVADSLCPPKNSHRPSPTTLSLLTYNVGGRNDIKLRSTLQLILKSETDIVAIHDIGVAGSSAASYKRQIHSLLPPGYTVFIFPSIMHSTTRKILGGMLLILSRRLTSVSVRQLLPLGALVQLQCSFGRTRITALCTYVPYNNSDDGSLLSRLSETLNIPKPTVLPTLHKTINSSVRTAITENHSIILAGDFNASLHHNVPSAMAYLNDKLGLRHAATPTELTQPSYENGPLGTKARVQKRIDYILYRGALRPLWCQCITSELFLNDHKPVMACFDLLLQSVPHEPLLTKAGIARFSYKNVPSRNSLITLNAQLHLYPDLPPSQRLAAITHDTVSNAASLTHVRPSTRGGRVSWWSPVTAALVLARKNLILIMRHVCGYRHYTKWTPTNFGSKLLAIRNQWIKDLHKIAKYIPEQLQALLNATTYGPTFWTNKCLIQLAIELPIALTAVRQLSTSKLRQQRADDYRRFRHQREYLYQIHQLGSCIQTVFKKYKKCYLMEDLYHEGVRSTSPGRIHEIITRMFRDTWFNTPKAYSSVDWVHVTSSETAFQQRALSLKIPHDISSILWKSTSKRPDSTPNLALFQSSVMSTPSFDDFVREIKNGSADSAGGPSGLTYGMMKTWPAQVQRAVYDALAANWTTKEIPDDWKWRWLLPIPKAEDPTLKQLRPLSLMEVLRKLWSKLFVRRITDHLYTSGCMNPNQHGGKGKGTDSAVLEFLATLETAKELNSELFLSSWDLSRAFDCVARELLIFSFVRMGIPPGLAQYLVNIDAEGLMVLQSPIALLILQSLGKPGLLKHDIPFHPERGTAQGGVDSALVFVLFIDILLSAIDIAMDNTDRFYLSDIDGNLQPSAPIGYIDDLIHSTATAKGLQQVADVVSGFCLFFGMDLNTTKFRAYALNWGNPNCPEMATMTIHGHDWSPTVVNMKRDGTMEHLGVMWDMSITNDTMYRTMESTIDDALQLAVHADASQALKLEVIRTSLINQIAYAAKFATWSLAQYEKLDTKFNVAFRTIGKHRPTFPTLALYMSKDALGLQLPQLSAHIQLEKYRLLQRSMYSTDPRRRFIISSLQARVLRQVRSIPSRYGPYTGRYVSQDVLPMDNNHSWWFSSLFQHMSQVGLTVKRDNLCQVDCPPPVSSTTVLTPDELASLLRTGLSLPTEVCMDHDSDAQLLSSDLLWTSHRSTLHQPIPLRQGQIWARHCSMTQSFSIHEIAGFYSDDEAATFHWTVRSSHPESHLPRTVFLPYGTAAMRGAGTTHMLHLPTYFSPSTDTSFFLVHLSREHYLKDGNRATCLSFRQRTPYIPRRRLTVQPHPWFCQVNSSLESISFQRQNHSLLDLLFNTPLYSTTTIISKTCEDHDRSGQHALVISHDATRTMSLSEAHVFGLFVGASQTTHPRQTFISHNLVAHKHHRTARSKPTALPWTPLLVPTRSIRMFPTPSPSAEQRTALAQLSKTPQCPTSIAAQHSDTSFDTRCFLLRAHCLSQEQLRTVHPAATITSATDMDFLTPLLKVDGGAVCSLDSSCPFLQDYADLHLQRKSRLYYTQRDQHRNDFIATLQQPATYPAYWASASMTLAAAAVKRVAKGATYNLVTRILLDWHLTGRNKLKCDSTPLDNPETGACRLCSGSCEDQQHILCHCSHSQMVAIRQHHLNNITILINLLPPSSFHTKIITHYHNAAIQPAHYELLLGRIHPHSRHVINQLPVAKSDAQAKAAYSALVKHIGMYLSMAITLYQTRQTLLSQLDATPDAVPHIDNFDPVRMRTQANEMMLGIDPHHVVRIDGSTIHNAIEDTVPTVVSKSRQFNSTNTLSVRKEQAFVAHRTEVINNRARKLAARAAYNRITTTDHAEWNGRYKTIDSIYQRVPSTLSPSDPPLNTTLHHVTFHTTPVLHGRTSPASSTTRLPLVSHSSDKRPTQRNVTNSAHQQRLNKLQSERLGFLLTSEFALSNWPPTQPPSSVTVITPTTPHLASHADMPTTITQSLTPMQYNMRLITDLFSPIPLPPATCVTISHSHMNTASLSVTNKIPPTSVLKPTEPSPRLNSSTQSIRNWLLSPSRPLVRFSPNVVFTTCSPRPTSKPPNLPIQPAAPINKTAVLQNRIVQPFTLPYTQPNSSPPVTWTSGPAADHIPTCPPPCIQLIPAVHDTTTSCISTHLKTPRTRRVHWDPVPPSPPVPSLDDRLAPRTSPGTPGGRSGQG